MIVTGALQPQSAAAATAEPIVQLRQSGIDSANLLVQAGEFAEAGKRYSQIVTQNPKDYLATLQLGRARHGFREKAWRPAIQNMQIFLQR